MRRPARICGAIALALLLGACGGGSPTGTGGTGGTGGSAGSGGAQGLAVPGSYELVFGKVTATSSFPNAIPEPAVQIPSENMRMRFDVRAAASGGLEALITPRFGTPGRVSGTLSGGAYALTGDVVVSAGTGLLVSDHWSSLRVTAANSGLGSTVTLEGSEMVIQGDIVFNYDLTATAELAQDATAPELTSAPSSRRGPSDALLPWDPISVDVAEPVAGQALEQHASVQFADADRGGQLSPAPVVWRETPNDAATSWAGIVHGDAFLAFWDRHPAAVAQPFAITVSAGVADPAGHPSARISAPFAVLDAGAPQPSFLFDDPSAPRPAAWGSVAVIAPGTAGSRCEHGGCLEIGPYRSGFCNGGPNGIAGRVQAPTGTLGVRYRIFYAAATPVGTTFSVEVAHAGSSATVRDIQAPSSDALQDLGETTGPLHWATPWTTVTVALPGPLPPVVIDLGFALSTQDKKQWCGGLMPPPVDALVVIDSLTGQ